MSSTNRSKVRESHVADYYVTPINSIKDFFDKADGVIDFDFSCVVDCCAGGNKKTDKDAFHPMSYPTAIKEKYNIDVVSFDIREDSLADYKSDYLNTDVLNVLGEQPTLIITNPPFSIAAQMIEKAISDVKLGGYVVALLRLIFFGSKERESFFKNHMPEYCFVHHIRMSFTDKKDSEGFTVYDKNGKPKKGGTDSIEYAHFVFRKGHNPEYTKLFYI